MVIKSLTWYGSLQMTEISTKNKKIYKVHKIRVFSCHDSEISIHDVSSQNLKLAIFIFVSNIKRLFIYKNIIFNFAKYNKINFNTSFKLRIFNENFIFNVKKYSYTRASEWYIWLCVFNVSIKVIIFEIGISRHNVT